MVIAVALVASLQLGQVDTPRSGAICELSAPLTVATKNRGRGKKSRLRKSERLTLVTLGKGWARVRVGDSDGYVRSAHLRRRCTWSSPRGPDADKDGEVAMASLDPAMNAPSARHRPVVGRCVSSGSREVTLG